MRLHVAGQLLEPLAEGALWWPERRILVVSDLHLEKGSSYAVRGQLLPPFDTSSTLSAVEKLAERLAPDTIVSLGDSFHDRRSETRLSGDDTDRIRALTAAHDWVWVEGNHDPDPPAHLGGRAAKTLREGALVFRHEPLGEAGEVAGHLHPCVRIQGKSGRSVRARCFATDGQHLVMPAMGAFTGNLNVLSDPFEALFPGGVMAFAATADRVFAVSPGSMIRDGKTPRTWRL